METTEDSGRRIHERATTVVTGFDDTVRRITTAYDSHGRVATITSFDHATPGSGSVLNEVQMQYDDWGNLAHFAADPTRRSAPRASVRTRSSTHSCAPSHPGGRHTLRRTYSFDPGDASAQYTYAGTGGLHDGNLSRVTQLDYQIGVNPRVTVAKCRYLGIGGGTGDLVGTGELDETRTPNLANEILKREPDGAPPPG